MSLNVHRVTAQKDASELHSGRGLHWRSLVAIAGLAGAFICACATIGMLLFAWPVAAPHAMATIVAASLFALVALAALKQPPRSISAQNASNVLHSVEDAPTLVIDRNGTVESSAFEYLWVTGASFADHVHLRDRVTLLSALAALRCGECQSAAIPIRVDMAGPGRPQQFQQLQATLSRLPNGQVGVRLKVVSSPLGLDPVASAPQPTLAIPMAVPDALSTRNDLAMVSHELRTPLGAIIGFSELLRDPMAQQFEQAKRDEYVDLIHGAATHLLSIVNAFLDVSRIEAGRYSIAGDRLSPADTVRDAVAMVLPHANAKNIALNLHLDGASDEVVADGRAIKQIVINLVSNAVKFTPEGGCVTVDANVEDGHLALKVADTGIGISSDDLARIGEPFAQIDNAVTRNADGSGLGLMLVKGLVALHRGTITVNSTPDVGTLVDVAIPVAMAETGKPHEPAEHDILPENSNAA